MPRFRAFLSYSHADEQFAARFHRDLERWRADRALLRSANIAADVPRDLRPIFRDREDFPAGGTLREATEQALRSSDFMILLCSPASAKSRYVNEEVRRFKALGGAERIIPVIIDGEPGDPEQECFPYALTHRVDADGQVTDEVEDRLAADARDHGDGPRRALAKVIAGILGLPFDEIVRRGERAQRRRLRSLTAIAATMAALALAAAGFGWLAEERRADAERNYQAALDASDTLLTRIGAEIVNIDGVTLPQARGIIERALSIYQGLAAALPEDRELTRRLVAAHLLFGIAYTDKGHFGAADDEFVTARRIGQGLGPDPAMEALLNYAQMQHARVLDQLGRDQEARVMLEAALRFEPDPQADLAGLVELDRFAAFSAELSLVDMDLAADDLDAARAGLDRAARRFAAIEAEHSGSTEAEALQATAAYYRARVAIAEGDDDAALQYLNGAIDRLRTLMTAHQNTVPLMAGLAVMLQARAELLRNLGDEQAAEASSEESRRIMEAANAEDVDQRQLRTAEAAQRFDAAIRALKNGRIADGLAALEPAQALLEREGFEVLVDDAIADAFHRDLASAARALRDADLLVEAKRYAKRSLEFREDAGDPAALADALSLSASIAETAGDYAEAVEHRAREVALRDALAEDDPGARFQLADTLDAAALSVWRVSRRADALALMRRRLGLLEELSATEPDNEALRAGLVWSTLNVAELNAMAGDPAAARAGFRRSRDLAAAALAETPDDVGKMMEAAWTEARLAHLGDDADARWRRVDTLLTAADALQPLNDMDEELMIVARMRTRVVTSASDAERSSDRSSDSSSDSSGEPSGSPSGPVSEERID